MNRDLRDISKELEEKSNRHQMWIGSLVVERLGMDCGYLLTFGIPGEVQVKERMRIEVAGRRGQEDDGGLTHAIVVGWSLVEFVDLCFGYVGISGW